MTRVRVLENLIRKFNSSGMASGSSLLSDESRLSSLGTSLGMTLESLWKYVIRSTIYRAP